MGQKQSQVMSVKEEPEEILSNRFSQHVLISPPWTHTFDEETGQRYRYKPDVVLDIDGHLVMILLLTQLGRIKSRAGCAG